MVINTKYLDGMRFIFALWVFFGHFYTLIGGPRFIQIPLFGKVLTDASAAVDGFMICTGFLMAYNYIRREEIEPFDQRSTVLSFWTRRFFRLYPIYFIALVVAYISFEPIALLGQQSLQFFTGTTETFSGIVRESQQPGTANLISHLFLIHGLIPAFHENLLGVSWSLSLEMQFYLVFPFLFYVFLRNGKAAKGRLLLLVATSVLLGVASTKLFGRWLTPGIFASFDLPSVLTYKIPLFILGMVMAAVGTKKISYVYLGISLMLIMPFQAKLTNMVIVPMISFMFLDNFKDLIGDKVYWILAKCRNLLCGRIAHFGANVSYSLYLIHTMIIPVVLKVLITSQLFNGIARYQLAVVALLLCLASNLLISYLLFKAVEMPFIAIGKKITKRTAIITVGLKRAH